MGCQHHVLDRVIKHVLDKFVASSSTKLTLSYPFVEKVINNYSNLCQSYDNSVTVVVEEAPYNPGGVMTSNFYSNQSNHVCCPPGGKII